MKKSSTFRLDPLAASRLEIMAKSVSISQAEFIEKLISTTFDYYCHDWYDSGDKIDSYARFRVEMHDRTNLIKENSSPE